MTTARSRGVQAAGLSEVVSGRLDFSLVTEQAVAISAEEALPLLLKQHDMPVIGESLTQPEAFEGCCSGGGSGSHGLANKILFGRT